MQAASKREVTMKDSKNQGEETVAIQKRQRARWAVIAIFAGCLVFCVPIAKAQDDTPPLPIDPTPLANLLTAQEKTLLADARNPKKTVEAYIKIAEDHITAALEAIKANDTARAEHELDVYQKAMAEDVKAAAAMRDGQRSAAKKVEQSLYKTLRTLETVERLFPVERIQFADVAIKRAKQYRVQMLNIAIASGDVLKDPDEEKQPTKDDQHNTPAPPRPPQFQSKSKALRVNHAAWQSSSDRNGGFRHVSFRPPVRQIHGDYMTEEEDDHVRQAQAPDDRVRVFMRIADRRLEALNPPPAPAPTDTKAQKKEAEEKKDWGVLPKMDRAALLLQYARAIEECMAKLDDSYERNPKSKALAKALDILRDATDRQLQTLHALSNDMKDARETDALHRALEQAQTANDGAHKGVKAKSA
jgi:hypothetical protein